MPRIKPSKSHLLEGRGLISGRENDMTLKGFLSLQSLLTHTDTHTQNLQMSLQW